MDIYVSTYGGTSFTYLYTVSRYDANATTPYWQMHKWIYHLIFRLLADVGFEAQSLWGRRPILRQVIPEVSKTCATEIVCQAICMHVNWLINR
jgi:hypothetical protein